MVEMKWIIKKTGLCHLFCFCVKTTIEKNQSRSLYPHGNATGVFIKRNGFFCLFFGQFNKKEVVFEILKMIIYPPGMLTVDVIFGRVNNRY